MRLSVIVLVPVLAVVPLATSAAAPLWARWRLACREPAFAWPLGDAVHYTIRRDVYGTGTFGSHRRGGRSHNGVDLAAPIGTPVAAAKSGMVRYGRKHDGMGRYLEIHHLDGSSTLYGHLSKLLVTDGRFVRQGQPIGLVGKTGNARPRAIQPHLHFELRLRGVPMDPLDGYLEGTEARR